jgi:Xaa-Pro aminopeptidase
MGRSHELSAEREKPATLAYVLIPKSPPECFSSRRSRLLERHPGPAAFGSGLARIRNFEANRFPFRAESHFLYFVGRHIEGALLSFEGGRATLYAPTPEPGEYLWRELPNIDRLAEETGLEVRPLVDFEADDDVATIAPDDTESALWLEELLGRVVDAGAASDPSETDLALTDAMIELRLRHDEWAIAQIQGAADVTVAAHIAGMRATRSAKRESEVRAAMEAVITAEGLSPAYGSIVTTRGSILHHDQSRAELGERGLLLADVGAEGPEGWASDVTRTWPVRGTFDSVQRELYAAVLEAQTSAIALVKPGVRFLDVHREAARALTAALVALGLFEGDVDSLLERDAAALFFPHGVGHLLGLDVHDMEDLGDRAGYGPLRSRSQHNAEKFLRLDRDLEPGMVVTIEPGFYSIDALLDDAERFGPLREAVDAKRLAEIRAAVSGIRIEDDVLVTADGCRVLTDQCPKTPDAIETLMGG